MNASFEEDDGKQWFRLETDRPDEWIRAAEVVENKP